MLRTAAAVGVHSLAVVHREGGSILPAVAAVRIGAVGGLCCSSRWQTCWRRGLVVLREWSEGWCWVWLVDGVVYCPFLFPFEVQIFK